MPRIKKKKVLHVFWQDLWIEMRWIIDFMPAFRVTQQDAHLPDILLLKRLNWNRYQLCCKDTKSFQFMSFSLSFGLWTLDSGLILHSESSQPLAFVDSASNAHGGFPMMRFRTKDSITKILTKVSLSFFFFFFFLLWFRFLHLIKGSQV